MSQMENALAFQPIERSCRHCGLLFAAKTSTHEFCCAGCEFVFGFLKDEGLETYYSLRDQAPPSCPLPAQVSSETYEFCDDAEFIAHASPDGFRLSFYLEGLNCTACLWLLEKLPDLCSDCASARVNMSASLIEVSRHSEGSFATIARMLNRLGHRPHPIRNAEAAETLRKRERTRDLIRIGVAGAATGNIMILAVSLYGGATGELASQFRWLTFALAAPVLTYCAWPFYLNTWASLRSRHLNIDVPIVAAIVSGIVLSFWGLATGAETLYFDSLSTLVFLLLSSRFWLKSLQQQHLDVSHLEDELLTGTVTRLLEGGAIERVSTLSLKPGDRIEVNGDMTIPADGKVLWGEGFFHTAALTGEADTIATRRDQEVEAGSRNLSGNWVLEVSKLASESRLASILRDTEFSARSKPAIVLLADQVSHWFVAVVMTLALLVAVFFLFTDPQEGFSRALALVIVTCPCVFGMAIPLSMSLGIRAAARRGLVIKDANALERLTQISSLNFDKTGTLTRGEMKVIGLQE